jgi:hypothetical protein
MKSRHERMLDRLRGTAAPSRSPGQPGAEHLMMSPDKQAELIRDVAATKLLPSEAEIPEASCH